MMGGKSHLKVYREQCPVLSWIAQSRDLLVKVVPDVVCGICGVCSQSCVQRPVV